MDVEPGWGWWGALGPPCGAKKAAWGGRARALLSTCRTTVASACPAGLEALQMYWPESCWATRGMMSVSPSSRCCQGSGERSLDQWIVGLGLPTEWSGRGWYRLSPRTGWGAAWSGRDLGELAPSWGPLSGPLSHRWVTAPSLGMTPSSRLQRCLNSRPAALPASWARARPHLWLSSAGWLCVRLPQSARLLPPGPGGPLGPRHQCLQSLPLASAPCPVHSELGIHRCPHLTV